MSDYIKIDERKYWLKCLVNDILGDDGLCEGCKYVDHGICHQCRRIGANEIIKIIDADVTPVIRCKDCKYWDKDTLRHNSNDVAEWDECECEMLANRDRWNEIDRYCCDMHFCADAERKDDETD